MVPDGRPGAGQAHEAPTLQAAATPAGTPREATHVIPRFVFENGRVLQDMRVGYVSWGHLNNRRDNAVLLTPGTSGGRLWATSYIGPGKAFDPARYCIVSVDAIGGGASAKPADGLGVDFPAYTIRDMVRAQHHLVTQGLGLGRLLAVGGPSMGSFQGIEWGVTYPEAMRGLILWVPAARSDRRFQAIADAIEAVITLDPGYQGGRYARNPMEGIRRAGLVYFPWLYSDTFLTSMERGDDAAFLRVQQARGERWAQDWDANSLVWRYRASRGHDVSRPFDGDLAAALSRVRAEALVVASSTDRAIFPDLTMEMVQLLPRVDTLRVQTDKGHLAFSQPEGSPEWRAFNERTREFLERLAAG